MSIGDNFGDRKVMGIGSSISDILYVAYGSTPVRTVLPSNLPTARYDFIAKLPHDSLEALQKVLADQFGLIGRWETRDMDVFVLTALSAGSPKPSTSLTPGFGRSGDGNFVSHNQSFSGFVSYLEGQAKTPVIDETGLSGKFDLNLNWDASQHAQSDISALQSALRKIGLGFEHARRPIKMLIVERQPVVRLQP